METGSCVVELFSNCVKSSHWIWSWWLLMVFGDKSFVFQAGDCETFLLFLISCIDITFTDRVSLSAWAVMGVCTVWKRATDGSENASQLMWSCTQTPVVNRAHALSYKSVTTSETPGSCSWFWEEAPDLPRATVTIGSCLEKKWALHPPSDVLTSFPTWDMQMQVYKFILYSYQSIDSYFDLPGVVGLPVEGSREGCLHRKSLQVCWKWEDEICWSLRSI